MQIQITPISHGIKIEHFTLRTNIVAARASYETQLLRPRPPRPSANVDHVNTRQGRLYEIS